MRAVAIAVILFLGACREERPFDDRYAETQNKIAERSNALDAELNNTAE